MTMDLTIKKLTEELIYNELNVLAVIEADEDLTSVFKEVTPLSFKLVRTIANKGQLNKETQEVMRSIFDSVICTKTEYIHKYLRFASGNTPIQPIEETIEDTVEEIEVVEEAIVEVVKPVVKAKTTTKKEVELPRRYGLRAIEEDIKKQGGKATPVQRAMLKVNDLKNIYVNLSARGIKDMVGGTNLLSDEDCRKIASVITIAERQLLEILKKK